MARWEVCACASVREAVSDMRYVLATAWSIGAWKHRAIESLIMGSVQRSSGMKSPRAEVPLLPTPGTQSCTIGT